VEHAVENVVLGPFLGAVKNAVKKLWKIILRISLDLLQVIFHNFFTPFFTAFSTVPVLGHDSFSTTVENATARVKSSQGGPLVRRAQDRRERFKGGLRNLPLHQQPSEI
jgi:hypothetical protein